MRALAAIALLFAAGALAAAPAIAPFDDAKAWRFAGLGKKPPTRISVGDVDGAQALRVEADASYGNFVHEFEPHLAEPPGVLTWQWRVDERNEQSDLYRRGGDDTTLKVCALFDMPIERVPFVERQMLRLARSRMAESLPTATVCYVWDAHIEPGTSLDNAITRRVRYMVLRGPSAPLRTWMTERRDLVQDFKRLFGDESPEVPPLEAVGVGADADNTGARSLGWVRALQFGS